MSSELFDVDAELIALEATEGGRSSCSPPPPFTPSPFIAPFSDVDDSLADRERASLSDTIAPGSKKVLGPAIDSYALTIVGECC